jgi:hypothetical protein
MSVPATFEPHSIQGGTAMNKASWTSWRIVVPTLAASMLSGGCGTVKTSNTTRTGTEQLLLTNAWDSALQKVDFRPLAGVPVYLDTSNVTAIDQGWVVSSIKQAMLTQGVLLRQKPEQAQWVVEARVGVYGTDSNNWLLGIQQTTVPQTITGVPAGTIPKIPLIEKQDQRGIAKLALFAYERSSGQLVWNSGTMLAVATAKDVQFLGIGPIQSGTIRPKAEVFGVDLPIPSEGATPDRYATKTRKLPPFSTPQLRTQPPPTGSDGFSP